MPDQCEVRVSDRCVNGRCPDIVNAPDGTACDDGNRKTKRDVCRAGVCAGPTPPPPPPPPACPPTGNACTVAVRQSDGTCLAVPVAEGTTCNDGSACTSGDSCHAGVCGGTAVQCPDSTNPCLVASCQASGGCGFTNVADGTSCDDGSACTTGDSCHSGVCGGTTVQCPGSTNPCLVAQCQASGGCGLTNVADGTACNDGDACTSGSTCEAGVCGGGGPLTCTSPTDTCDAGTGGCATDCGPSGCVASAGGPTNPTLTVPFGALTTDVRIKMVDLGPDPTDATVFRVYQFTPDGTQFITPATVDLPAPPLAPGHTAVIEVTQGTGWVAIPTTRNGGRLTGPISHFSGCRTRDVAPTLTNGLVVDDMVHFQDIGQLGGPFPGCNPGGGLFGICVTLHNGSAATVNTATATIFGWQCYNRTLFSYTNPVTGEFEGTHCNPGLLIPCGSTQVTVPLPAGGLAPGDPPITVQYSFQGTPLGTCFDGSADVGIDFVFREPTATDQAAGMRSAKDGPFVSGALFKGIYPPPKIGATRTIKNFLIQAQE